MESLNIIEKNKRFILRQVKDKDGVHKLVKSFAEDHPSLDSMAQLKNELEIGSKLDHPGIRKVYGEIFYDNRKSILLEYIEGENLKKKMPMDLGTFFHFSLEISNTLDYIHEQGLFHRDISSYNIMHNAIRNKYQIIDFGTTVDYDSYNAHSEIVGTPAYTSPELTGRLQIVADKRADLYSLGVVFYEMLTGNNPFMDSAEMQTIYKQIAWLPTAPHLVNPSIPISISRIIMNLLAKQPDLRYRSVKSLIYDLEEAQLLFRRNVVPVDFEPGSSDKPAPYNNSPKLINYQEQKKRLNNKLDHLLSGVCQKTLLIGPTGMGKSSLIHEMLPRFIEEQVLYLNIGTGSGHAKPYAYLFDLFESIIKRIDEEPEDRIEKRKTRFNSKNIADVSFLVAKIPSLGKYVDATDFKQEFGSIQSQNRFQLALQDLLRMLAIPERPIIAHFSKAELIDTESADFLKKFTRDIKEEFLWVIFEENTPEKPEPRGYKEDEILKIEGIADAGIIELFKRMVIGEIRNSEKLTEYLLSYSNSNPSKAIELIRYWHKNHFFEFDQKRKYWFWQNDETLTLFPESIIETNKIDDPIEKDILEWASLIEGKFSFKMINALSEFEEFEVLNTLQNLNIKNQVISIRNGDMKEYYKLSGSLDPDTILPDRNKQALKHNAIANFLIEENEDRYTIASHINKAALSGDSPFKGKIALKINLEAGMEAKGEGAFALARHYFKIAKEHLTSLKEIDAEICYQLYLNSAELTQLDGDHIESDLSYREALKHAKSELQTAQIYARQVTLYNHLGKHEDALQSGFKALDTLGYSIPHKAGKLIVLKKLIRLWVKVGKKDPQKLLNLPDIQDEGIKLSFRIIESLHTAIFNKSSDLLAAVILISMERILKYGNAPEGYSAYAGFGAILALGFSNYKKGWDFTLAGANLTDQSANKMYMGRGLFSKGAWIVNYIMHSKHAIPMLEEGIQLSKESGDFSYATNGTTNLVEAHFMVGTPFLEFENIIDEHISFTHQIGFDDILALCLITKRYILLMTKREDEIKELSGNWFKNRDLEAYTLETSFKHIRIYYLILESWWQFFSGNTNAGIESIELSKPYLYTLQGPAIIVDYYLIKGILYYERAKEIKDKKAIKIFRKCISKLKKYAKLVEDNYSHRYLLLSALNSDLKGNKILARKTMRRALSLARKYDYMQIEAISCLYLARWFQHEEQKDYARLHFRDALNVFERWESSYLSEKVVREFDEFTTSAFTNTRQSSSRSYSRTGHSGFSNPEVLMQSALSVAAETDFEALLDVMNTIFIEQAGATRSLLFIKSDNQLCLLYAMENQEKAYYPFPGKAINTLNNIPKSLLQLVQRSHESINIEDSSKEQRFKFEPYFKDKESTSILIKPLIYRGDLSGIIYFENNLLTGAFSEQREELIKLLSGQFAVALQNAQLVEELEHRVKERTLALKSEKDRADLLLKNILPAETAEELKLKGKASPRYYENVTVMFTDFIGFTRTSEKMHPEELVKMLDFYFKGFDRIIIKYGLEKIKTIGDAYLCVSGLPIPNPNHAALTVRAALEILQFIKKAQEENKYGLDLRIGIHSGPVVAGVVGEEKFAFDIWGDTVNTASRMESNSEAGRINISKQSKELLDPLDIFTFSYRGKVPAKNKGDIDMYFIEENQIKQMDSEGAIAYIIKKLREGLSDKLTYHSIDHTFEIMENTIQIGTAEGLNEEEMKLLKTASAFHDAGFLYTTDDHEQKSAEIAGEILPEFGYNSIQIEKIKQMIIATQIPQQPKDLLSKVLCDADLYYLGTPDFFTTGDKLFEEFKMQDIVEDRKDWIELQIRFLKAHVYHTNTAKENCETKKQEHIILLQEELDKFTSA